MPGHHSPWCEHPKASAPRAMFPSEIEGTVSNVIVKFPRMRVLYSVTKMILGDVRVQTGRVH